MIHGATPPNEAAAFARGGGPHHPDPKCGGFASTPLPGGFAPWTRSHPATLKTKWGPGGEAPWQGAGAEPLPSGSGWPGHPSDTHPDGAAAKPHSDGGAFLTGVSAPAIALTLLAIIGAHLASPGTARAAADATTDAAIVPALVASITPAQPLIGDHVTVTLRLEGDAQGGGVPSGAPAVRGGAGGGGGTAGGQTRATAATTATAAAPAAAASGASGASGASAITTIDLASVLAEGLRGSGAKLLAPPAFVSGMSGYAASAQLMPLSTGPLAIGPFVVDVPTGKGDMCRLATPGFALRVPSLLPPGMTQPADVKPPLPYGGPTGRLAAIGTGAVAAIILIGMWLWRRTRRPPPPPPPPPPPEVEARRRIQALLDEGPLAADILAPFVDRLTDILRHYLGRRYGMRAMAETTDELVVELTHHPGIPDPIVLRVGELLQEADLVKFAPIRPALAAVGAMPDEVLSIVGATTPSDPESPGPAPAAQPAPGEERSATSLSQEDRDQPR